MEHDPDWPVRMTTRIGERVARIRAERKMTVQALADRCAELGVPLGRVTLTKLEGGKRQAITPAEVAVLAAALRVAPVELLYPIGFEDQIEILPGRVLDGLGTAQWYSGELNLEVTEGATVLRRPSGGEEGAALLLAEHQSYVDQVAAAEVQAAAAAEELADAQAAADHWTDTAAAAVPGKKAAEAAAGKAQAVEFRNRAASTAEYRYASAVHLRDIAGRALRRVRAEMSRRGMRLPNAPSWLSPDDDGGA